MDTSKLKTALYGRVSKDDPKKSTIEIQQQTLAHWSAADPQIEVCGEYWDDGISGKIPLWERPQGRRLVADVNRGGVQCVAVAKADRFGRTLLDGLQAVKRLEDAGVKLVAVDDGWDSRRKDSPLYFQFRMMIAEEDHRRILERFGLGKERAMVRDEAPPGGPLTFGYRIDSRGRFVPDAEEAAIVIGIFERYLAGHTMTDILAWVSCLGVRAGRRVQKRESGSQARVVAGQEDAQWSLTRIGRLLRNRTYLGERQWGKRTFACPPLIASADFERVQARLTHRPPRLADWEPGNGLLHKLLKCTSCGTGYYARNHQARGTRQYVCSLAAKTGWRTCQAKILPFEHLDAEVWKLITSYLANPQDLVRRVLQADEQLGGEVAHLEAQEQALLAEIADVERQVGELWAEQKARNLPVSWVGIGLEQLAASKQKLEARRAELQTSRAHALIDRDRSAEVTAALAGIRARLGKGLSPEEKREIVKLMVAEAKVTTVGTGKAKCAEVAIRLRWGEVPSMLVPQSVTNDLCQESGCSPCLTVVLHFGRTAA